jgi:hypothetical protein
MLRKLKTATEAEAKAMDDEVVRILGEMRCGWLRLGLLTQKMIDTQAYVASGFTSMHSWMAARLGGSKSNAFAALKTVRALSGVPESQLENIGTRNAQVLIRLPEKERKSEEWIKKASTLPERELRAEVDAEIEKKTGMPKERFRYWGEAVPESLAQKLDEMLAKICNVLELDLTETKARITALEALAATILNTPDEILRAETEGIETAR